MQRHRSAPPFNAPYLKETKKKNEVQPNKESKKRKREKEKEKERGNNKKPTRKKEARRLSFFFVFTALFHRAIINNYDGD